MSQFCASTLYIVQDILQDIAQLSLQDVLQDIVQDIVQLTLQDILQDIV